MKKKLVSLILSVLLVISIFSGCKGRTGNSTSVNVVSLPSGTICQAGGWEVISSGNAPEYLCNGVKGANGTNGTNGINGINGYNTLISFSIITSGNTCSFGGTKINSGLDTNRNGILEPSEITTTDYVCNGTNGTNGNNGIDGTNGQNGTNGANGTNGLTSLITFSTFTSDNICKNGGEIIYDTLGSTTSKVGEICNGVDGTNGNNGTNGTNGTNGNNGTNGLDGTSCTVVSIPSNTIAPNGGALISCTNGKSSLVLNGIDGQNGNNGTNGTDGQNGSDGTVVTAIQFCDGAVGSYPDTFPEIGFCIDNTLYAVYSANGGFLSEITPGDYASDGINASCNFTVLENCQILNYN